MARHADRRRPWAFLRSTRVRAALALGTLVGFGSVNTMAYWTDSAIVTGGTFTAGSLDIKLGDPAVDDNPAAFTTNFAMADMVPGSEKDAVLKVRNSGTVPFTFHVTGTATNNGAGVDQMGAAIRISVFPWHSGGVCSGTALVSNLVASGQILPEQPQVAASTTRDLCFRASLPTGANTALQGNSTVVSLTFHAQQVTAP